MKRLKKDLRIPSKISRVDEEDTSTRHSGRSGSLEMTDLKQEPHGGCEGDSLVTGQGQNLVVVHDGVEGLNPHGINVTIQDNPFGSVSRDVSQVSHDSREETVFPFTSRRVDDTEQLVISHSFGIEILGHWLLLHVLVGLEE